MKFVFYSSTSSIFNADEMKITTFPKCYMELTELTQKHPEWEFFVVTQKPGTFLLDLENGEIKNKCSKVHYEILDNKSWQEIAEFIIQLKPDLCAAASFWGAPVDWFCTQDSLIADYLEQHQIKTIACPLDSALIYFNKWNTNQFLKSININVPCAVFVSHELFFKTRKEIQTNVYREAILSKIKKMNFPVVIKDTTGLSSYGMDVVNSYEEAEKILTSKRNNGDRIIEEYIQGIHFGAEIYGKENDYFITEPFALSLNRYGITSPKQSVKLGPAGFKENQFLELKESLLQLAKKSHLQGIAQADLVLSHSGQWYIVEINPRISGMTAMNARQMGFSTLELLFNIATKNSADNFFSQHWRKNQKLINLKFPLLQKDLIEKLNQFNFVLYINQIENMYAKQDREVGYCETIISGDSYNQIISNLEILKENFGSNFEEAFLEKAKTLKQELEQLQ